MLLEFSVENFLSFKQKNTLSLVSANIAGHEEDNVFTINDYELLKTAIIYGANASGKTNLIKAMRFMKNMVMLSSKESQSGEAIDVEPFKFSIDTHDQPSEFEIIFIYKKVLYRYGFTVDSQRVYQEWLFYLPNNQSEEIELFERRFENETETINLAKPFKEGEIAKTLKIRKNALFLSVAAQLDDSGIAGQMMEWFRNGFKVLFALEPDAYESFTLTKLKQPDDKQDIMRFLKAADTAIENLEVVDIKAQNLPQELPKGLKGFLVSSAKAVMTEHRLFNNKGETVSSVLLSMKENESEGTKKLFALSGSIIDTLKNGEVLIVDELDAKLHPLMMRFILNLFQDKETNPHNAQLIFETHDTNLLSPRFFRRDQIWFAEKDPQGATDLFCLAAFQLEPDDSVNGDSVYKTDYFQGRYGAIPLIGEFALAFEKGALHHGD
jgi:AAA15 family ATPase/GTPase